MNHGAGGAAASRLGTCAAKAPQCAGYAVQLRRHGRFAGAARTRDNATRRVRQIGRQTAADLRTTAEEAKQ